MPSASAAAPPVTYFCALFGYAGALTVSTGQSRYFVIPKFCTVDEITVSVGTAPTGGSLIVDILRNDVSLWPNASQRPTIVAGGHVVTAAPPPVPSLAQGDLLKVSVVQVGATVPGSDLGVQVFFHANSPNSLFVAGAPLA